MAKMIARIRTVIDVPFEFDIPDQDLGNENQINVARIDAAKHAESELVNKIKDALDKHGVIVEELVEEVREAE